ncbi:DUF3093 domain-containing protein [Actinomycetospora sp. NBRC 106378]|uniref:DUF3093 domain-containing protein n=1 Tax=Actinomycetospora sp. NBRC 106378 TaxID=3032208 RepID=UPI0024A3F460|nr:DUF3093 domain-containing protein [Actinomycetospora sp. NBRC 106378]GLZ54587.1 hypothetical protein Acsp07_42040 [Actinomycetospora sp. NBRC 106378]
MTRAPAPSAPPAGLERLRLPWWAWPPSLLVAGLLAAEVHMGFPGVRSWLPYVLLLPLAVLILSRIGRTRVGVATNADGEREVWAGPAHLPVRFVGRADVVRGDGKQHALGPQLDPAAFVLHRPWIASAVRLEVTDPDDPTPYWVVSTRHPERLLAQVRGE